MLIIPIIDPNNVAFTGGAIDGVAIGGTTKAAGGFTTLVTTAAATFGTTVSVNAGNAGQNYLILEGLGTPPTTARGGGIEFWLGTSSTDAGFIYYDKDRRIVFDTAKQSEYGDYGFAWIETDTGAASFAGADFTISSAGILSCAQIISTPAAGTGLVIHGASGNLAKIHLNADLSGHDIDRWRLAAIDGGVLEFANFASGAFVDQVTMTPADPMTDAVLEITGNVGIGTESPDAKLQVVGTAGFGDDAGNETLFAADGLQTMVGTARVKKLLEFSDDQGRGANSPTVRVTEAPYLSYTYAEDDDSHFTFEVPHNWAAGTDLVVHVHWYTSVSQTGDEVNWQLGWLATPIGGGEAVNVGVVDTDTSGDVNCPTQWHTVDTTVGTIEGALLTADDLIGFDITRIAIVDGTDPQVSTIHVLSVEIEYIADKLGEAT